MLLNWIIGLSALCAAGICRIVGGFGSFAWIWLLPLGFAGCFLLCLLLLSHIVEISDISRNTARVLSHVHAHKSHHCTAVV